MGDAGGGGAAEIPERWLHCPRYGRTITVAEEGEPNAGAGFVPFKTPLDSRYDAQIPPPNRWTLEMLLGSPRGSRIGFIIDLTKSKRYYDAASSPVRVQKLECAGHGEAPTADQVATFIRLCDLYWSRPENKGKLIGVHCTHGYNRTGAMIVSYLVERCDMSVEKALIDFSIARHPGIYKPLYVTELCERYDGVPDDLVPTVQPSWSLPDEEVRDALMPIRDALPVINDAEPMSFSELSTLRAAIQRASKNLEDKKLSEALESAGWSADEEAFVGGGVRRPADLRAVVEELLAERQVVVEASREEDPLADANESPEARSESKFFPEAVKADPRCAAIKVCGPPQLGELRKICREMIDPKARKGFSGAQPVSLGKDNIEDVRDKDYLMSWKADGTRYLMLIHEYKVYLIGRDNAVFRVPTWHWGGASEGMWFPAPTWSPEKPHRVHRTALIDGEMVVDVDPRKKRSANGEEIEMKRVRYLAYDLLVCGDKKYHTYPYAKRLGALQELFVSPREKLPAPKDLKEPFGFRHKPFFPVSEEAFLRLKDMVRTKEIQHETDGFIFALNNEPYTPGTCDSLLKWKPPELNSFDFIARVFVTSGKCVATLMVTRGDEEVPFDLTGVSTVETGNAQEREFLEKLDGKVLECVWLPRAAGRATGQWRILKARFDKTHPNSWWTCEKVWQSVRDGIKDEQLHNIIRLRDQRKRQREAEQGASKQGK